MLSLRATMANWDARATHVSDESRETTCFDREHPLIPAPPPAAADTASPHHPNVRLPDAGSTYTIVIVRRWESYSGRLFSLRNRRFSFLSLPEWDWCVTIRIWLYESVALADLMAAGPRRQQRLVWQGLATTSRSLPFHVEKLHVYILRR